MITVTKQDNGVLFTFENSDKYLYGSGTIEVPFNSLSIIQDESDMITLRKSASWDIFLAARYDTDLGYRSKEEAVEALKGMLYDEAGVSEEEVQEMIDAATSGMPSSQVVEQLRTDVNTISGDVSNLQGETQGLWDTIDEKEEVIASALTEVRQDVADIDAKEEVIASALTEVRQDVADIDAKEEVIASALTEVRQNVDTLSGDVQTKVATSDFNAYSAATATALNAKADLSAVTAVSNDLNTLSGAVIDNEYTVSQSLNDLNSRKLDASAYTPTDLSQYWTSAQTQSAIDDAKAYYVDFQVLTTQGIHDADWDGLVNAINAHRPIYAELGGEYYTAECLAQSGNQIIMTASNHLAHFFYTFTKNGSENYDFSYETRPYTTDQEKAAWNAKQDALTAGSGIEISGNVISATGGGGATYSAGTNIDITNDTINCTLPIEKLSLTSNQDEDEDYKCLWINPSNVKIWIDRNRPTSTYLNYLRPAFSFGVNLIKATGHPAAFGQLNHVNGFDSFATGDYNNTNNNYEFATGAYNNSVNDSTASGQTLFSVGNGTSSARHNAFEIRQNGDIYVNDGTNDVRLQDTILALGGLKFVQCSQSEYDALVSGGTVDSSTIYFITNVVS